MVEVVPPPLLLWILPLRAPPALADRSSSARLSPLAPEAVSALGGLRGRLLLPDLRVSGSRSHHLACPSIGRPGGTGVRSLG